MPQRFDETILKAEQIAEAVAAVEDRLGGIRPDIGVISGSGFAFGDDEVITSIPYADVPHLPEPGISGHSGEFILTKWGERHVLIAHGRLHRYEGFSWDQVTLPVRIFAGLGCKYVVLTAAVGSVNIYINPGDIVIVADQINLMGDNPLVGKAGAGSVDRFVDLNSVYDKTLIELAEKEAEKLNLEYHTGVYAAMLGPAYETPAEVRMISKLGGEIVGMSVVPEATVAAECGLLVLGICVAANRAGEPVNHEEVLSTVRNAGGNVAALIKAILENID